MTKIKDLAKCKHPNSRKTKTLVKQVTKAKLKLKNKQASNVKLNLLGEKVMWFRDNIDKNVPVYTRQQTVEIINRYLSRFNEELEQIRLKHSIGNRKNRQHASREDIINMTIKREREEYEGCGLEMPDLLDPKQFELLKKWNGELRFLQNFKFKRLNRAYLEEQERNQMQTCS